MYRILVMISAQGDGIVCPVHYPPRKNFAYPVRCQSRSRVRPVAAVEFFIRGG